jgi:23S rRNA pseudoU1915 N3-methylase RlmH
VSGFARQFVDSAVAADGWKKQVRGAIEAVLKGAGFIADAYTGLKLVFASVRQGWLETVNFIISASMGVVNGVTVLRSKLKTGWQVAFAGIEESFASVRDAFKMVGLKIQEAWQSMLAKMKLALGNFLLEVSQGMSGSGIAKVEAIAAKIGNMGVAVMKGSALGITEVKKEIDELTKAGEARARNNAALIEQILLQGQQEMNAGIQENMNGDFGQIAINFSRMTEQNREAWRKMISDTVGAELSSESMAKLIEQLRKAAEESAQAAVGGAKTLLTELNEQGVDAAGKLSSVFQGFFNGFDEGVKGMLNVWKQNLAKMASDNLAKSLLGALPGSSDSGGSDLGGLFKGLFGFARGGSFEVGGNGGTDSNLVAFRATKGERVTIQTPDQQRAGGGGNVININNYFQGSGGAPDATMLKELDRRDQKIKADIANAMRRKRF